MAAAALLGAAGLLGAWLLALHQLRPVGTVMPWTLRAAHGVLGLAGLAALLRTLTQHGGSVLLWDAAGLAGFALGSGLTVWLARRRLGGSAGMVLFLHAFLGFTGAALVAASVLGGG